MSSAKDKGVLGSVLTIAGSLTALVPGFQALGYSLIALGAALGYAGARQLQKEAERRARAAQSAQTPIRGNVRGSHEHHLMVFGKSRVGGIVAASGTNTPSGFTVQNEDLYLGVEHSITHSGGCDGMGDFFWIDTNKFSVNDLNADPDSTDATINYAEKGFLRVAYSPTLRRYVATAATGDLAISTDGGRQWTTIPNIVSGSPNASWEGITWSPDEAIFVAVGSGAQTIMTSPDGFNWTARTAAVVGQSLSDVAWSPALGLFAAVATAGSGNRVQTSPDGITWTSRTAPTQDWTAITWSPDLAIFCAVSSNGTDKCITSSDGITWTSRALPTNAWRSVAWSPSLGLFAAVATSGSSNRAATSPDGITWTLRTTNNNAWRGVAWSERHSLFCAVASTGTGDRVMTSTDGITWTTGTSPSDIQWQWVIWNDLQFVAVANTGTGERIMTSPDGINWTLRTTKHVHHDTAVRLRVRAGTGTQTADTESVAAGIDADTAYRRGICWTRGIFKRPSTDANFSDAYHFALPTLTIELRGIKCYDPRLDSTNGGSGSHRHTSPTTWAWTDNPILHAATYSIMERSDGGWGIPAARIDWDSVIDAADICEESKTTPAGTRNRFVGGGVISTADTLETNLQKLLDACLGRRVRDVGSGTFKFHAAAYTAPTFVITDDWLAGSIKISTRDPLESIYNAVRINYNDAELDYTTIEAPPFTNASYEAQDGGERLWKDLTLPMVHNTYDAQYLGQILGKKSRYQMTIEAVCNLRALDVEAWEACSLEISGADLTGRIFRVEQWSMSSAGIVLTLKEDHPDIYTVDEMAVPA